MKTITRNKKSFASAENLYRIKDDPELQADEGPLRCPPAVIPLFERPLDAASTVRSPMNRLGWDSYLKELNGDKYEAATHYKLAMFNGTEGNMNMETLIFMRNLCYAIPSSKWGWHQVLTYPWDLGPPIDRPTYKQNPILVQKFTLLCKKSGNILARNLFYPVVSRVPLFIKSEMLEPWSKNMETLPPPVGMNVMQEFLFYVRERITQNRS